MPAIPARLVSYPGPVHLIVDETADLGRIWSVIQAQTQGRPHWPSAWDTDVMHDVLVDRGVQDLWGWHIVPPAEDLARMAPLMDLPWLPLPMTERPDAWLPGTATELAFGVHPKLVHQALQRPMAFISAVPVPTAYVQSCVVAGAFGSDDDQTVIIRAVVVW